MSMVLCRLLRETLLTVGQIANPAYGNGYFALAQKRPKVRMQT